MMSSPVLRCSTVSRPAWFQRGSSTPRFIPLRKTRASAAYICARCLHSDGRARLSNIWVPTSGLADGEREDGISKLAHAGFLWSPYTGIFHLLPLGTRVQGKLCRLVQFYMQRLGASQVQLSVLSSQKLWEKTARLQKIGEELFRLTDRNDRNYLLSPTHEEEITSLVAYMMRLNKSYKWLPLRLFQITSKFRDEARPRSGLLRSREFTMKDLYTFDYSAENALETYEEVRKAYREIFVDVLKLPIQVARAASGDMGGSLSHEYHLPTELGEDHIVKCDKCDYLANDEVAKVLPLKVNDAVKDASGAKRPLLWRGITTDRKCLVNVWYPSSFRGVKFPGNAVNVRAVRHLVPGLDVRIDGSEPLWSELVGSFLQERGKPSLAAGGLKVINVFDYRIPPAVIRKSEASADSWLPNAEFAALHRIPKNKPCPFPAKTIIHDPKDETQPPSLLRIQEGDLCPSCADGRLTVTRAIELGHTFHLGTRYSVPLDASVTVPTRLLPEDIRPEDEKVYTRVPLQMGCHGIGISRTFGAVAYHLADARGLNWPRAIAPYEVVVVPPDVKHPADAERIFDLLASAQLRQPHTPSGTETASRQTAWQYQFLDPVLDDRDESVGWKLKDADLIGYPVVVVLRRQKESKLLLEVRCRRLNFTKLVAPEQLVELVTSLLDKL